ncbi:MULTISPECIES: RHS repeat-associated core domain-containing protein [unclassified Pseudomonas]|uniref:RHS repeat-associated core domain-containing protein n=1 Tax=unclassified Pseudomonas TaxID=196821 RepID=UPI0035BEFDCA
MPITTCSLLASDAANSVLFSHRQRFLHTNTFTPYGYQATPQTLLGFNGALRESAGGNYVLGNGYRLYRPALMRFLGPDKLSPFGKGGANSYAYCLGEPVNRSDPSGAIPLLRPKAGASVVAKALVADRHGLPLNPASKQFAEHMQDAIITTSLPGNDGRLPSTTPAQSRLGAHVQHMQSNAPFPNKVRAVVLNKESRNKPPISGYLQDAYIANVERVRNADISSVTAHLNMLEHWGAYEGPRAIPTRTVARALHLASAVFTGVEEQASYKTGAYLRRH